MGGWSTCIFIYHLSNLTSETIQVLTILNLPTIIAAVAPSAAVLDAAADAVAAAAGILFSTLSHSQERDGVVPAFGLNNTSAHAKSIH